MIELSLSLSSSQTEGFLKNWIIIFFWESNTVRSPDDDIFVEFIIGLIGHCRPLTGSSPGAPFFTALTNDE